MKATYTLHAHSRNGPPCGAAYVPRPHNTPPIRNRQGNMTFADELIDCPDCMAHIASALQDNLVTLCARINRLRARLGEVTS